MLTQLPFETTDLTRISNTIEPRLFNGMSEIFLKTGALTVAGFVIGSLVGNLLAKGLNKGPRATKIFTYGGGSFVSGLAANLEYQLGHFS
jgi:hypothetical protein